MNGLPPSILIKIQDAWMVLYGATFEKNVEFSTGNVVPHT